MGTIGWQKDTRHPYVWDMTIDGKVVACWIKEIDFNVWFIRHRSMNHEEHRGTREEAMALAVVALRMGG